MTTLRITTIGNSAGLILPRSLLRRLRVVRGDLLHVIDTPSGIQLTPYDPDFARQVAAAETIMRDDRDVLRGLTE